MEWTLAGAHDPPMAAAYPAALAPSEQALPSPGSARATSLAGAPPPAEIVVPEVAPRDRGSGLLRRTLRFESDALETAYQATMGRESLPGFRLACLSGIGLWVGAGTLLVTTTSVDTLMAILGVGVLVLVNVAALLAAGWATTINRQHGLATPIAIVNALGALGLASAAGVLDAYAVSSLIVVQVFWFVALTRFVFAAVRSVANVGAFTVVITLHPEPISRMLDLFLLLAATIGILLALYRLEVARRRIFERDLVIAGKSRELEAEQAKTKALLRNVLPASVASELLARPGSLADEIQDTTVLFADLVGFTPLAARLSAAEVVRHLNEIFLRFDALAERHGIEKVKTIGDAYMAVGGLPVPQDDHAVGTVRLGLDMVAATREYAAQSGLPLALRVGVHSGPVVAGVIGRTRLSYDLWGDTVNVASRMEQHGLPDAVQVSESTWTLVSGSFSGRPRGDVELRGRGEVGAWIVTGTTDLSEEAAA